MNAFPRLSAWLGLAPAPAAAAEAPPTGTPMEVEEEATAAAAAAWLSPELFRFGASSLLGDIERQLEHHVTGRYAASHRHAPARAQYFFNRRFDRAPLLMMWAIVIPCNMFWIVFLAFFPVGFAIYMAVFCDRERSSWPCCDEEQGNNNNNSECPAEETDNAVPAPANAVDWSLPAPN